MINKTLHDNLFISGRTGSGKSYYFQHTIFPQLLKDDRQMIIIDMKGEYDIGLKVNINSITSPVDLAEIQGGKYSQDDKGNWIPPKITVIQAKRYTIPQIDMIFQYLNYALNKIIIFEEASFFFGTTKLKTGNIPEETDVFLRCGTNEHNNNHNIIFITQYPNDMPKKVISICSKGYIFYLPMVSLQYLYTMQFIEEKPEVVKPLISPYKSYKMYEVE